MCRELCADFFFILMGEELEKMQKRATNITQKLKKISYLKTFKEFIGFVHQKGKMRGKVTNM